MRLEDRVAIVTGAGQGIGRVCAHKFAEQGARVVIAEHNEVAGRKVADEIVGSGRDAWFVKTDVSDEKSTEAMAKGTVDKYGCIDILINNAALFSTLHLKPFEQITVEEWDRVMAVNLRGPWLCCKAVAPFMKARKKGKIINVSSSAWNVGLPFYLHYITSKAGVVGLTHGLARELGEWNINVNCVAYTGVMTGIQRESYSAEAQKAQLGRQFIKRPSVPEELVGTLMFLASEESDFLTGQTIHPNGGIYLH